MGTHFATILPTFSASHLAQKFGAIKTSHTCANRPVFALAKIITEELSNSPSPPSIPVSSIQQVETNYIQCIGVGSDNYSVLRVAMGFIRGNMGMGVHHTGGWANTLLYMQR